MPWNVNVKENIKKLKHKPKLKPECCGHPQDKQQEEFKKLGMSYFGCTRFKGHKGAHNSGGSVWSIE